MTKFFTIFFPKFLFQKNLFFELKLQKIHILLSKKLNAFSGLQLRFGWWVIALYLLPLIVIPILTMMLAVKDTLFDTFLSVATLPVAVSAYKMTLILGFLAAFCNTIFGSIIAWVLVRYQFPGKRLLDSTIDLPFALPTSVAGLTIANMYGTNGWLATKFNALSLITETGIKTEQNVSSRFGIVVAMIFVSLPFVVRTIQPVLQDLDNHLEEAAWLMGASSFETLKKIIIPSILPSILTGMTLSFSRAIGEFGSVVIVSSNLAFHDLIAPVLVFQRLEQQDRIGATVIGTVMLLVSLVLLVLVNALQSIQQKVSLK